MIAIARRWRADISLNFGHARANFIVKANIIKSQALFSSIFLHILEKSFKI